MAVASVATAVARTDRWWRSVWRQPPGWVFHLLLVAPAVGLLWATSVPGLAFFLWSGSEALLLVGAVVWMARLTTFLVARHRSRSDGRARWFFVAPLAGAVALALIVTDAPFRARWALSRSDFEAVVQETLRDKASPVGNRRVGLYDIVHVQRKGTAVLFYERNGLLFDDAGFAYLPDGPSPELENGVFERPEFRHVGGPWYVWTASW